MVIVHHVRLYWKLIVFNTAAHPSAKDCIYQSLNLLFLPQFLSSLHQSAFIALNCCAGSLDAFTISFIFLYRRETNREMGERTDMMHRSFTVWTFQAINDQMGDRL